MAKVRAGRCPGGGRIAVRPFRHDIRKNTAQIDRMQTSTGKRLASALAAAMSVATLTAFAVAPLTEQPLPPSLRVVEPLPELPQPAEPDGVFLRQAVIARGESLGSLFRKLGEQDRDLVDFVRLDPKARKLLRLQTGVTVRAEVDGRNQIQALSYPLSEPGAEQPMRLEIERTDDGWNARIAPMILDRTVVARTATITSSLYAATDRAGIPDAITARIPEILGSEIDFHRDVRKGDKLRIVYEMFADPETLSEGRPGRLLAVDYEGAQRRLQAIWFDRGNGEGDYYDFDGRSLHKSFLRSPLEFTRITSGFTSGRRHPVFRDWRAHKGIDYAAPAGTKIRTIGEGVVEFVGVQRGYGKVVIVRHDRERSTLYAHMSRFAPKLKEGTRLEQGEVIGYVGQTGWASGPHLHFEFLVNGEPNDPAAVIPPPQPPLDQEALARLRETAEAMQMQMRWQEETQVAAFE
jgi:murein DD-endopeptidase MepM/ murein hydrolase activator NlpD